MNTAPKYFLVFFPFITALIISGCTLNLASTSFQHNYAGYPCADQCDQFQAGYETAKNQKFTLNSNCQTLDKSERLGCLSYLHEYNLIANQPSGYIF